MTASKTLSCFHCGESIPENSNWTVQWNEKEYAMCCPGCQSVMEMIISNGLEEFYLRRDSNNLKASPMTVEELNKIEAFNQQEVANEYIQNISSKDLQALQLNLFIEDIVCSACVWLIEKKISQLPYVNNISINAVNKVAAIEIDSPEPSDKTHLGDIIKQIRKCGYHPTPLKLDQLLEKHRTKQRTLLKKLGVAGLGMMQVMMFAAGLYAGTFQGMEVKYQYLLRWVSMIVATIVVIYSATEFFNKAWASIRSRQLGMDIPVAIAIGSSYGVSVFNTLNYSGEIYFDSAVMFTFFLLIGRYLQSQASWRALESTLISAPNTSPTIQKNVSDNDQKQWQYVSIKSIQANDEILIPPGEIIPVDGMVIEGESEVDQAVINGEVQLQKISSGSQVLAGCTNHINPIVVLSQSSTQNRFIDKIAQIQADSLSTKSKTQSISDHFAQWFVFLVLLMAVVTFYIWMDQGYSRAFTVALTVLIITCPCALSLATPAALTASIARAKSLGLLITNPDSLMQFSKINWIVFDKTGTLTSGNLSIEKSINLSEQETESYWNQIVFALETGFDHPIAQTFINAFRDDFHGTESLNVYKKQYIVGKGVQGVINGKQYHLGYFPEFNDTSTLSVLKQYCAQLPYRIIFLYQEQKAVVAYLLLDKERVDCLPVIQKLKLQHKKIAILSGDPSANATSIKDHYQVDEALTALTPEQKMAWVRNKQPSEMVMMIGDGLNDAPVLSQADVSVAMPEAVTLSKSGSDIILLQDSLTPISHFVELSRFGRKIIKQNLSWAIAYNVVTIPLAMMGDIAPWLAAAGMSLSSIFVVLNALRISH